MFPLNQKRKYIYTELVEKALLQKLQTKLIKTFRKFYYKKGENSDMHVLEEKLKSGRRCDVLNLKNIVLVNLCNLFSNCDDNLVKQSLKTICSIVEMIPTIKKDVYDALERCGGFDNILLLQYHYDKEVYKISHRIISLLLEYSKVKIIFTYISTPDLYRFYASRFDS